MLVLYVLRCCMLVCPCASLFVLFLEARAQNFPGAFAAAHLRSCQSTSRCKASIWPSGWSFRSLHHLKPFEVVCLVSERLGLVSAPGHVGVTQRLLRPGGGRHCRGAGRRCCGGGSSALTALPPDVLCYCLIKYTTDNYLRVYIYIYIYTHLFLYIYIYIHLYLSLLYTY